MTVQHRGCRGPVLCCLPRAQHLLRYGPPSSAHLGRGSMEGRMETTQRRSYGPCLDVAHLPSAQIPMANTQSHGLHQLQGGRKYSFQNQEEAENWGIRMGEGTRLFSQTVLGKTRLARRDALAAPCSPCPPPPLPFSFSMTHKWTYSCCQHVYKPQSGDILNKPLSLFGP